MYLAFLYHLINVSLIRLLDHLLILFLSIVCASLHAAEHDAAELVALSVPALPLLAIKQILSIGGTHIQTLVAFGVGAQIVFHALCSALSDLLLLEGALSTLFIHGALEALTEVNLR